MGNETQDDFENAPGEQFGGREPLEMLPEDVQPVLDGWPKPTNSVADPANNMPDAAPQNGSEIRDRKGRVFDPNIHSANPDGSPKFNKNGLFIFKGVGKPKKNTGPAADDSEDYGADQYDAQAQQIVHLVTGSAAAFFDDEKWLPENAGQNDMVKNPTARFLRENNMPQLPAWMECSLAWTGYSLPRMQSPKTREKLVIIWLRVRSWFGKKKKDTPAPAVDENERKPDESSSRKP